MLLFGFGLSMASLFYILVVLAQKVLGISLPGWTAIMSALLLLGGVQIMMLGFIGLYVGAVFRESKGRPRYIIKEVVRH
jgi:dolichol-phosphate mannosyltransferase